MERRGKKHTSAIGRFPLEWTLPPITLPAQPEVLSALSAIIFGQCAKSEQIDRTTRKPTRK